VIVVSTEDNLQQLHEIHESIQQMRDQTTVQALNSQVSAVRSVVSFMFNSECAVMIISETWIVGS
jgi:hypothetical protein